VSPVRKNIDRVNRITRIGPATRLLISRWARAGDAVDGETEPHVIVATIIAVSGSPGRAQIVATFRGEMTGAIGPATATPVDAIGDAIVAYPAFQRAERITAR
jgi:hypothetical protein